jgi:hypothetical protein
VQQGMSEPVVMEEQVPGSDTHQVQGKRKEKKSNILSRLVIILIISNKSAHIFIINPTGKCTSIYSCEIREISQSILNACARHMW